MRSKKVILFDIDGTLLSAKGLGTKSLYAALKDLHGVQSERAPFSFHGQTDTDIFHRIAELEMGRMITDEEFQRLCELYIEKYRFHAVSHEVAEAKPGVPDLLAHLSQLPTLAIGLETGNLEPIAYLKLEAVKIRQHFSFGGFATDSSDRAEIVRIALERAKAVHDLPAIDGKDVFVVGDAPQDVHAGKAAGATTIAVATGALSAEDLQSTGADYVFKDLSNLQSFLEIIAS